MNGRCIAADIELGARVKFARQRFVVIEFLGLMNSESDDANRWKILSALRYCDFKAKTLTSLGDFFFSVDQDGLQYRVV